MAKPDRLLKPSIAEKLQLKLRPFYLIVDEKDPKKRKVDVSDISEQQDSRKLQERLYRRIISSLTGLHK